MVARAVATYSFGVDQAPSTTMLSGQVLPSKWALVARSTRSSQRVETLSGPAPALPIAAASTCVCMNWWAAEIRW